MKLYIYNLEVHLPMFARHRLAWCFPEFFLKGSMIPANAKSDPVEMCGLDHCHWCASDSLSNGIPRSGRHIADLMASVWLWFWHQSQHVVFHGPTGCIYFLEAFLVETFVQGIWPWSFCELPSRPPRMGLCNVSQDRQGNHGMSGAIS
jgi:hypothetical protein